jgi:hypothetical protein
MPRPERARPEPGGKSRAIATPRFFKTSDASKYLKILRLAPDHEKSAEREAGGFVPLLKGDSEVTIRNFI